MGSRLCNNYHTVGCKLGTDAVSRSVRNYTLSDPYEEMHRKFGLFVLYGKTCSSPSVLIIDICLDSRIWPRIESWPTSVFMTKWPSFYLKISCFSFKAGNKQLNQKLSSLERGLGLEGERKAQAIIFSTRFVANPSPSFPAILRHDQVRVWEWPESGQGRIKCRTWRLTFTLSNVML